MGEGNLNRRYVARILQLGFLAPDITAAILANRLPARITVDRLRGPIPLDWNEQRRLFDSKPPSARPNTRRNTDLAARRSHLCHITDRETGPPSLTPEREPRTLAEMTPPRALHVLFPR